MAKDWIAGAIKKPGALRMALHTKPGQAIPIGKLRATANHGGKIGERARLALTLRKMNKG